MTKNPFFEGKLFFSGYLGVLANFSGTKDLFGGFSDIKCLENYEKEKTMKKFRIQLVPIKIWPKTLLFREVSSKTLGEGWVI